MSSVDLPVLRVDGVWMSTAESWSSTTGVLRLRHDDGSAVAVRLERCVSGRLENAYPVSTHDIEVHFVEASGPDQMTSALGAVVAAIQDADPGNRRVVFSAPRGDIAAAQIAENAGFRHVVDVDLAEAELSLLVWESQALTQVDLDHVPGT